MVINQLNYGKTSSFEGTSTSKDVLLNKVGYGNSGKIIGNAPITTIDYNAEMYYKFLPAMDGIKLTNNTGEYSGLLKPIDNNEWEETTIDTTIIGVRLGELCYGNGIYIGCPTNSNYIPMYSYDGLNYTQGKIQLSTNVKFGAACYGGGKFIILGFNSNVAAYSEDGITWTQTTLPSSTNWSSVCYGNGKFVAVSTANSPGSTIAAYSEDGINWTQTELPTKSYWNHICYGNGKFVACTTNDVAAAAYSEDGVNWTQTENAYNTKAVCYGNGKFVALCGNSSSSNVAIYSEDGITWTQIELPDSDFANFIAYGNGKFIAVVSNSNKAAYSENGINWVQITLPISTYWLFLRYGGDKFILSKNGGNASLSTTVVLVCNDYKYDIINL